MATAAVGADQGQEEDGAEAPWVLNFTLALRQAIATKQGQDDATGTVRIREKEDALSRWPSRNSAFARSIIPISFFN